MVRAESYLRAITYAQKYLSPWAAIHMKEFQRVFATVAFRSNSECAIYKVTLFLRLMVMRLLQMDIILCDFGYINDRLTRMCFVYMLDLLLGLKNGVLSICSCMLSVFLCFHV